MLRLNFGSSGFSKVMLHFALFIYFAFVYGQHEFSYIILSISNLVLHIIRKFLSSSSFLAQRNYLLGNKVSNSGTTTSLILLTSNDALFNLDTEN